MCVIVFRFQKKLNTYNMTFKKFVFNELSPTYQEAGIANFISRFSNDADFPDTEDI